MLMLTGTLPIPGLGVISGEGKLVNGQVGIRERFFPVHRGTAAMMSAAIVVCKQYGLKSPFCVVSGDIGEGEGSFHLYQYLKEAISHFLPEVIVFHYIMPNWYYHDEVMKAIKTMKKKPILIADAGYMYVAKMSGFAPSYDVFTPDLGELAFLADGEAPHPFYTRGFIFQMENKVEELIRMAYSEEGAANYLLVKGHKDFICCQGKILATIEEPDVPELEAIGGTGDTITGMVAALIYKGLSQKEALIFSARANRIAGKLANPTPATQIGEIIEKIPQALDEVALHQNLIP